MIHWKIRLKGQHQPVYLTDQQFQNLPLDASGNPDIGIKASNYTITVPNQAAFTSTEVLGYSYERLDPPASAFASEQASQINQDGIYRLMLLHALHYAEKYALLSEEDKFAAELLREELAVNRPTEQERAYRKAFRGEWFDFYFPDEQTQEAYFAEWKLYATGVKDPRGYSRERVMADVTPKTLVQEAESIFDTEAK